MKNMQKFFITLATLSMLAFTLPSQAHFQLVYTPQITLEKPAILPFKLVFTHPHHNGHTMDMGTPEAFYYIHKGKKKDLMGTLKPITWQGASNQGKAYQSEVKIKRNGDYIFVLEPAPYYEKKEDIYIQQITKSFVNKGAMPTGWNEPLDLKTEIVPLNKPYNLFVGSTFSGQVLSDGKPVPGLELEIEYINNEPNMKANRFSDKAATTPPASAMVVITDHNGIFTFGIPRAGFWGFAALGSGPDKEHKSKELSQDAVLWIRALDMK